MTYAVTIILLSGQIGSGKTTLAEQFERWHDARCLSTAELLATLSGSHVHRRELQVIGSSDEFRRGEWIARAVIEAIETDPAAKVIVVDAVRTLEQVRATRGVAVGRWRTLHIHLTGEDHQLAQRYSARARTTDAGIDWPTATKAELAPLALESEADLVIDTSRATPDDVAARASARIQSERRYLNSCVDVLVGGQWGSEGKGNLAFFLAPEYDLLVRVGAPNAGHKIHGYDGVVYTHRQLPSGTRATTTPLMIGVGAVISLPTLLKEITDCEVSAERLTIDPSALIIEDDDILREAGLKSAIGSTGAGGGAALARRIMGRGGKAKTRLAKDVQELQVYVRDTDEILERTYSRGESIFVEGTQGTSLSLLHGSFPHVTSRDTTVSALLSEVGIAPQMLRQSIVAFRSYPIRVGGPSGPMGQEISWSTIAQRANLDKRELESAELGSVSGNMRRVAEFSWTQLRRSARLNGATDIALTFLDYLDISNKTACRFEQLTSETIRFVEEVELVARAPVSLMSARFDGNGLIDRRRW